MDLVQLPTILARRWYVFVLVVAAAMAGLGVSLVRRPVTYEAQATIQITAPTVDDVQLVSASGRSASILRDDLLLIRNDFTVVVNSAEVRDRTIRQLKIDPVDSTYVVTAQPISDSNYLSLVVRARTPELAQSIANAHADLAIQYFGELRAKPAQTTADFLDAQLQAARTNLTNLRAAPTVGSGPASPDLQQALANYQVLLQKHSDAQLLAQDAAKASYIQVVEPAKVAPPPSLLRTDGPLVALTAVGSLGLAVLIALVLDALAPRKTVGTTALSSATNGRIESEIQIH